MYKGMASAIAVIGAFGAAIGPAYGCRVPLPLVLGDIHKADVVVVGRISDYRLGDFDQHKPVAFQLTVVDALVGDPPRKISVLSDNPIAGMPRSVSGGLFLIALSRTPSEATISDKPFASVASDGSAPYYVLARLCSPSFILESGSDQAVEVRRWLKR